MKVFLRNGVFFRSVGFQNVAHIGGIKQTKPRLGTCLVAPSICYVIDRSTRRHATYNKLRDMSTWQNVADSGAINRKQL